MYMCTSEDLREFRRHRNYYRVNFTNGESDESFQLWILDMCDTEDWLRRKGFKENQEKKQ